MKKYFADKATRERCHIYKMLETAAKKNHVSFHTPGHKVGAWDITELSFSDVLSAPHGCIRRAQEDIANVLGAARSFLLTDGSTSGVFAMTYAAKTLGVKKLAIAEKSHQSVYNACEVFGIEPVVLPCQTLDSGRFFLPSAEEFVAVLGGVDGVLITSPTYYGEIARLESLFEACEKTGKLLLVDGAHGGHLHFDKSLYAGTYAHLWVDGVHKSLPALTQGAVVSARDERLGDALENAVNKFRTTSPSYPIMASVEYAVKYPENEWLERAVRVFANENKNVRVGEDYTKLFVAFRDPISAQKRLEEKGIFAEFADGESLCFYLSPATTKKEFSRLKKALEGSRDEFGEFAQKPDKNTVKQCPAPVKMEFKGKKTAWIDLKNAVGRVCAEDCGLFPPCVPVCLKGRIITEENVRLLQGKTNVFGLCDGQICVVENEEN